MERLQNLCYLTFFLCYKNFSNKSRKLTSLMIGCAAQKGKLFVESVWSLILKHKKISKFIARRDRSSFIHSYEFSCSSTPQSSQPLRSRIKNGYKFLPCLSANAVNVESKSVVILPRDMMHHSTADCNNPSVVLAIEGIQRCDSSREQKSSPPACHEMSGALVPIECAFSPAGSTEDTYRERICNATKYSCNESGAIVATGSLWNPIGSKYENFVEQDVNWMAEEFIQRFYQKLREQKQMF